MVLKTMKLLLACMLTLGVLVTIGGCGSDDAVEPAVENVEEELAVEEHEEPAIEEPEEEAVEASALEESEEEAAEEHPATERDRDDSISAGYGHTVGLKSDGTVVATGYNNCGQCDASDWKLDAGGTPP